MLAIKWDIIQINIENNNQKTSFKYHNLYVYNYSRYINYAG